MVNLDLTEIHHIHNLKNSTCDPLKYKMGDSIHVLSKCMIGKSIRMKRVEHVLADLRKALKLMCVLYSSMQDFPADVSQTKVVH